MKISFSFNGRASRMEFFLTNLILNFVILIFAVIMFALHLEENTARAIMLPCSLILGLARLPVTVRRMHDIDFSGKWLLFYFIPILNIALEFILYLKKGTDGENRFGADPLERKNSDQEISQS